MKSVSYRLLMRHIILFFFAISLSFSSLAGDKALNKVQLDELFSPLSQIQELTADFSQNREIKKWQTNIPSSGNFALNNSSSPSILWQILQPSFMAIRIEKDGFFAKNNSDKSAIWKKLENKNLQQQMDSLFSWMSFDSKKIMEHYQVFSAQKNMFRLVPKNKSSNFSQITITTGKDHLIQKIDFKEKQDDEIHIQFRNTKVKRK